ncbi:MAG TPA: NfeD family protein [Nitrospiria bacterium]|nr:NfeD family protein [Nitrospiria bacterium]
MNTFLKYLLFQVPGWVILALILFPLWKWEWISGTIALLVFGLGILKDFILFPWLRKAYEPDSRSGAERLIGSRGLVQEPLDPRGYVRVNGELWQAESEAPGKTLPSGTRIEVTGGKGLLLKVSPAQD